MYCHNCALSKLKEKKCSHFENMIGFFNVIIAINMLIIIKTLVNVSTFIGSGKEEMESGSRGETGIYPSTCR